MNAEEYFKRGDNYFSQRNFDKAIEDFSETIKLEHDNPFAYYQRGLSYTNKKEFDLAIADFDAAIKIEPNKFGYFYFDRAGAYVYKGDKNSAISDVEMAIKIDPQNKDYHEALKDIKAANINNSSVSAKREKNVNPQRIILYVCTVIGLVVSIIGSVMSEEFLYIWIGIGGGVMLSFLIGRILEEGIFGIIEEGLVGFLLWFIIFGLAGPIGFFIRLRQTRN